MIRALIASLLIAQTAAAQTDPLKPLSDPSKQIVSPLSWAEIATADPERLDVFLGTVMGMQRVLSGEGLTLYTRSAIPEAVALRVRTVSPETSEARPGHDALVAGALALGFPLADGPARDEIAAAAGFNAVAGVTVMTLPRGDGTNYDVKETHYRLPDGILALGIDRADMTPVGPIDPASGVGGPAYASIVVQDAERWASLLRDVLGYEMRRDATFTSSGPSGGLALPAGTRFRFQQWFTPGAATGYLVILQYLDGAGKPRAEGTIRGLTALGFTTANLADIAARAAAAGLEIEDKTTDGLPSLEIITPEGVRLVIHQDSP
jgi:hypothetical protein